MSTQQVAEDTVITTDVSVFKITDPDALLRRGSHGQLKWLTLTSDKTGVIDVSWSTPSRIYSFGPSGFNINWAKADEAYPISGDTLGWATADGDARSHTLSGLETAWPTR